MTEYSISAFDLVELSKPENQIIVICGTSSSGKEELSQNIINSIVSSGDYCVWSLLNINEQFFTTPSIAFISAEDLDHKRKDVLQLFKQHIRQLRGTNNKIIIEAFRLKDISTEILENVDVCLHHGSIYGESMHRMIREMRAPSDKRLYSRLFDVLNMHEYWLVFRRYHDLAHHKLSMSLQTIAG